MIKSSLKLIDNSSDNYRLANVIKELLKSDSFTQVSIATGYWDLPGMVSIYEELQAYLEKENTTFRLLLGEEPSVKAYQVRNPALQDPCFPEKYLKKA